MKFGRHDFASHPRSLSLTKNVWVVALLVLPLTGCPLELHRRVLDQRCAQFGYNDVAVANASNYVETQRAQQKTDVEITAGLVQQFRNDSLRFCQPGRSIASLVQHVTNDGFTELPHFSGGAFLDDHWLLNGPENWSHYDYRDAKGALAVANTLGFRTQRLGISIDGKSDIDRALRTIRRNRIAGLENIWAVFFLKENCCIDKTMPDLFKGGPTQAIVPEQVYSRIENYCSETTTRLLNESELPIGLVAIGNEIDGGFFEGFDAGAYDGPPQNMARTKRIIQSCRNGVIAAYNRKGLQKPFFQLHVMPGTSADYNVNQSLINDFLSTQHVGEALFDNVGFSLYTSSRFISPLDAARRLRSLGEATGLPWGIVEMGMAQMRAPGLGGSLEPWNNHVSTDACRPMIGRSCVSLKERQQVEIETLHDYFMNSTSFFCSIYLNPTANILFNIRDDKNGNRRWDRPEPYNDSNYNWQYDPGESYTDLNNNNQWDEGEKGHGPSNQYRMSLWDYEPVFTGLTHRKAVITPAQQAYELILKNLTAPKLRSVNQTCPTEDNCELVIGGRNISANTRVKIRSGNEGKFLSRYHSDQISRINSSTIRVKLNRKDAKVLRAEGLTVELVRDDPWHYTMSNFCTLSPGIALGTCS